MNRTHRLMRPLAHLVIVLHLSVGAMPAYAAMVSTETLLTSSADRALVLQALGRHEVIAELEAHGVSAEEARARVQALSDAQVAALARDFHALPAGGGFVEGLLLTLFVWVILHATDYLDTLFVDEEAEAAEKKKTE